MNDEDSVFPSLPPDSSEQQVFENPAPAQSTEQIDDVLLEGLTQVERDRVVAAWARLEDVETSYPGTLAICLSSAARGNARACKQAVAALREAPDKILKASDSVNMSAVSSEKLIQHVLHTTENLDESVEKLKESQQYTEKMSKCNLVVAIALLFILILNLGVTVTAWGAAEQAKLVVPAIEQTRKLQLLTHSRLLLQSDENSLQTEWRKLQSSWDKGGPTEILKVRHDRLKEWKQRIDNRWKEQNDAERRML